MRMEGGGKGLVVVVVVIVVVVREGTAVMAVECFIFTRISSTTFTTSVATIAAVANDSFLLLDLLGLCVCCFSTELQLLLREGICLSAARKPQGAMQEASPADPQNKLGACSLCFVPSTNNVFACHTFIYCLRRKPPHSPTTTTTTTTRTDKQQWPLHHAAAPRRQTLQGAEGSVEDEAAAPATLQTFVDNRRLFTAAEAADKVLKGTEETRGRGLMGAREAGAGRGGDTARG